MFIHVNGVRLFYEKQGTGEPLILLHGNEEDHRIFDEAIEDNIEPSNKALVRNVTI